VYLLNAHFSQEYADLHYGGKESEMNLRYEWEDELEITSAVEDVREHSHAVFPLQGTMGDGKAFSYDVAGMHLFEVIGAEGNTVLGCSESILERAEIEKTATHWTIQIYLKDYEPMSNPIPGIYIAAQEFPKELID
jgi:hypothetical protein